jgi:hypothetical protein
MARYLRMIPAGSLVHVIVRFVNREFRICDAADRREYLRRLGDAVQRSDWRALAYGVMSSHGHLSMLAGLDPFERFSRPLHGGFATWLNARQKRLGPVFADRPKTPSLAQKVRSGRTA